MHSAACMVEVFTRVELGACYQRRNEALDGQPESIQGYRVPASKLDQCQGDSATIAKNSRLNGWSMQCVANIARIIGVFIKDTDYAPGFLFEL